MPREERRRGRREEDPDDDDDLVLAEEEDLVWIGFLQAAVSGAAASLGKNEDLDVVELALVADDMLKEYRKRVGGR